MQAQREGRLPTDVTNWPLEKAAKDRLAGRVRLSCDTIVELARELGVLRRLLYKWQDQLERGARGRTSTELAGNAQAGPSGETGMWPSNIYGRVNART